MTKQDSNRATVQLFDIDSKSVGGTVPVSVVLPPGFDPAQSLPLLIFLHGGGDDRTQLVDMLPLYNQMFADGTLPPVVAVSFSSGLSFYAGEWENFILDELPEWAAKQFNNRTDRDGRVMIGMSMGGYGTLKVAFKHPDRFTAIAAVEPAIEPSLTRLPYQKRSTWYRMPEVDEAAWGSPVDEGRWQADNPANLARDNAEVIKASGLAIYLEVGDQDFFNCHDGADFLHRMMWDHDIRHEYHLVRWADHVGPSLSGRYIEAHGFLAAALSGGLAVARDLELTEAETEWIEWWHSGMVGDPPEAFEKVNAMSERAPSIVEALQNQRRDAAPVDPEMKRAYAKLPPTS